MGTAGVLARLLLAGVVMSAAILLPSLSPAEAVWSAVALSATGIVALESWLLGSLLRQHGRLLLRVEALEAAAPVGSAVRPGHGQLAGPGAKATGTPTAVVVGADDTIASPVVEGVTDVLELARTITEDRVLSHGAQGG